MKANRLALLWRAALLMQLGAVMAGCSGSNGGAPTGPSPLLTGAAAPGSAGGATTLAATVRFYKAEIAPSSVGAGSTTTFAITVTNCSAATCDATHATTASQTMKSAKIQVPSQFSVDGSSLVVSATGGKSWAAAFVSGSIQLVKQNNDQLAIGEAVTVTFKATAPCAAGNYPWTTVGYNDTDLTSTAYTLFGSQPSVNVTGTCATGCTFSQGYWKTHTTWPLGTLTLGTASYDEAQLLSVLGQPVVGNGLISLAKQLIGAKLNIAAGADGSAIAATIASADALIGSLVIPPVGTDSLAPSSTSALETALAAYNEGVTGPGHCGDSD